MVGTANTLSVKTSGVGVITAATATMMSTAQRNWRSRKRGLTTPIDDNAKMNTGSSNMSAMPEDHREQEAQVARSGDRRLEVLADVDQELHGVGKRHVVGEDAAGEEEERAEDDERDRVALLLLVEARAR